MHIGFVPLKAPFRIGTAAILLAGTLCGTSFYASPTGSATGDGSFNAPWDLQTALNSTGAIQPGSTLLLRGGVYRPPNSSGFASRLAGSSQHATNIRNYQSEQATIDRNGAAVGLAIYGSNTVFSGLQVIDSTAQVNNAYVVVYGSAIKCIGLLVNNTPIGFTSTASNRAISVSTASTATGTALSGSVSLVATAAGTNGVSGVQFQVDGVNLGYKVTQAPYTVTWNTTTTGNANHTITAIASDPNGNKATATEVVMVKN
jgi:Big-like domain-containing protein